MSHINEKLKIEPVFPKAKEECPFVDRTFTPTPEEFNKPVDFPCTDASVYRFYKHFDGIDQTYNCQFCMLIGRKRDVFECLNKSEWQQCGYYVGRSAELIGEYPPGIWQEFGG